MNNVSKDRVDGHLRHEDFPWTIVVVDHPPRESSPAYRASRRLMMKIVETLDNWILAPGPDEPQGYEDHHGGGIWVKDDQGWVCVQLPLGIEWSAQFCADPAKVDALRRTAARIVAGFPATLDAYEALGYKAARKLLDTEIRTASQVAAWTDGIFNASIPVPRSAHTGVLPTGAGYHHYPKPIIDINHFKRDDYHLFVTDNGYPAVVVPVSKHKKDGVRLLAAHPEAPVTQRLLERERDLRALREAVKQQVAKTTGVDVRDLPDDEVDLDMIPRNLREKVTRDISESMGFDTDIDAVETLRRPRPGQVIMSGTALNLAVDQSVLPADSDLARQAFGEPAVHDDD